MELLDNMGLMASFIELIFRELVRKVFLLFITSASIVLVGIPLLTESRWFPHPMLHI